MKMKKFASAALVAAMSLSLLSGCGSKEAAGDKKGGDTWKIGSMGPLTGGAAIYGNAVVNGAELAIEEINAAGGINGAQIEYKKTDDEADSEKAINGYNTLKDWGMQVFVGSTTSAPTIAVGEKTNADNMFQITPSGSAVDCTKYDNTFRACFADPAQGTKSAQYIGQNKLATTIGIIYDSSDVYSSGIEKTFVKEAKEQGIEVKATEAFTADSKTDFTAQLQKCKDANVEMIFLPIYYQESSIILSQAKTMGLNVKFFSCDGMDGILTMENFDTSLAEGVMLLTPFSADAKDELTQNFVKNYKAKYGDIPNQFAADAYDSVYAVKAALEKAGTKPQATNKEINEALKKAMTEVEVTGVTGTITWTADGEPDKEPRAVVIKNGAYELMNNQ